MPWHPPIPASKLYSEPALKLGPALVLLVWCYDRINSDGTIEIRLETAATDIGKPYGTVRDWWRLLRDGPFFCELFDRGKRGWVAHMHEDWIDWHVMRNNYPINAEMSALVERRNVSDEDTNDAKDELESAVNAPSTRRQRRNVSDEGSAYKVLHDDHESESQRESENHDNAHVALSRAKNGKAHPAVALYQATWPDIRLTSKQEVIIRDVVGDRVERLECWREVIRDYELSPQWKPENLGNMRERFDRKLADRSQQQQRQSNGNRPVRQGAEPNPERAILIPASSDSWD